MMIKKIVLVLIAQIFVHFLFSQENVTYNAYWKNGMRVESSDGAFKFKFGGRTQLDWAAFFEDDGIKNTIGESANGIEFRRVRLFSSGQIYGNVKYKLQFDFAEGLAELKDAYIMLTDIPVAGFIQIGRFKEPIGFDELTSSKYITFMERALMSEDEPSRNTGLMIGNSFYNDRISFRLGVFKDTDDFGNITNGQDIYNVTGRIFGTPVFNSGNNNILHLGAAFSYRGQQNGEYELTIAPESHMANDYVSSGVFTDASNKQLIQTEALYIVSSLSLKSEIIFGNVKRTDPGNADFKPNGYYGEVAWFLTGESKQYNTDGEYDRVSPKRNYDGKGGIGAWEVALRYSSIDFKDEAVDGSELNNVTVGLNWYLNPATRFMFNYIYSDVKEVGKANIVQMRFQVDF